MKVKSKKEEGRRKKEKGKGRMTMGINRVFRSGKFVMALTLLFCFTGCSWQEYFVVSNSSNSEVIVQYKVSDDQKGFPIFSNEPLVYKLNNSKEIDWNSKQIAIDLDSTLNGFKLKIPANSALIFGELSNDHYTTYNQDFINDRHFNLEKMKIEKSGSTIFILPNTFDSYFKKKEGNITLEIK